jgi:hypothetical protein
MELFRQPERINFESGVVNNYQVVLANIGNVYLHRRDHFTATSYYQRTLKLAREIRDPVSIGKWARNINLAYARIRVSVDQQNPRIVLTLLAQTFRPGLSSAASSCAVRIRRPEAGRSRGEASHLQPDHGQVELVRVVDSLARIARLPFYPQLTQEYPAEVR